MLVLINSFYGQLRFCAAERWHVGRAFKSHGNRSVRHVKALSVVGFLPNLYLKVEIFRSHNRDQISYMKYYARWFFYIVIYFIFSLSPLLYKPPLILSISMEEDHLDINNFQHSVSKHGGLFSEFNPYRDHKSITDLPIIDNQISNSVVTCIVCRPSCEDARNMHVLLAFLSYRTMHVRQLLV